MVNEALEAGADGVMFVSSIGQTRGDFLKALQCTRDGGVYYPEQVRDMARQSSPKTPPCSRLQDLSERELDVLKALTAGLSNREIADRLIVSSETVKSHVSAIIGKLGHSRPHPGSDCGHSPWWRAGPLHLRPRR